MTVNHELLNFSPPDFWIREPTGSPKYECRRAYNNLASMVYEDGSVPSSVMDYAATYAYWVHQLGFDTGHARGKEHQRICG